MTAAIFALKNADPDEWQDRYHTETRVNVSVQQMSDDQLMTIVSGARPAMIEAKPAEAIEAATDFSDARSEERQREFLSQRVRVAPEFTSSAKDVGSFLASTWRR